MKRFYLPLIFTLSLTVASCSMVPQYYDNNEYELLARLETSVELISRSCADEEEVLKFMSTLLYNAELLDTYTFYIPRNTEVYEMAKILNEDVQEFKAQYDQGKATSLYCKLKSKAFLAKVRTALESVAKKVRK